MNLSNIGYELIKHFESLHDGDLTMIGLQPKLCPANVWTEGFGHAMTYKGKILKGIDNKELAYKISTVNTIEDANILLQEDVEKFEWVANRKIKVKLLQHQFDALLSHTFNCGVSETLYKILNKTPLELNQLKNWWTTKYISADGKILNGLIKRRETEYELFITGKLNFK